MARKNDSVVEASVATTETPAVDFLAAVRDGKARLLTEREGHAAAIAMTATQLAALDAQYREMFNEEPPTLDLPSFGETVPTKRKYVKHAAKRGPKGPTGKRGEISGSDAALSFLVSHNGTADTKSVLANIAEVTGTAPMSAISYLKTEGLIKQDAPRGGNYVLTAAGRKEAAERAAKANEVKAVVKE